MGKFGSNWLKWSLRAVIGGAALLLLASQTAAPVTAGSGDRALWLYHTHTHETGKFTFKHNGQYDPAVLAQMNTFLADWRTHRPTHMDPHLFDLLWEVYQDVGGNQPFNIVSSYREPKTNAMLRARSSAVAENSQHMLGKAMDVFIPGVPLATLRAAAMRHQVGGVGYYPTSGSPFVHMDTGGVRAWPRMTRAQLERVFPDGKTLHLPVDGKPLSDNGRRYAMLQWNQCHMVPCNGAITEPTVQQEDSEIRVASLDPAQRAVSTIAITAPVPMTRRGTETADEAGDAIIPFSKSASLMVATRGALPLDGQTALGAIARTLQSDPNAQVPAPRVLMSPKDQVLTAYAPDITPEPGALRALQMLIERETTAAAPTLAKTIPLIDTSEIRTASLGGTNGLSAMKNIFDMTWSAVTEANGQSAMASTLTSSSIDRNPVIGLRQREVDLVAPEIDHVNETLATPVPMTDIHYADMTEPEGYLDNAAELGPMANRMALESDLVAPPRYDRFVVRRPMLIASRG
ncbi:MAG: DUF882 domain-containing protein [Devosia sp.]